MGEDDAQWNNTLSPLSTKKYIFSKWSSGLIEQLKIKIKECGQVVERKSVKLEVVREEVKGSKREVLEF